MTSHTATVPFEPWSPDRWPPNVIDFTAARRHREAPTKTTEMFESVPRGSEASSTSFRPAPPLRVQTEDAELEIVRLIRLVQDEIFEDGIENELSTAIETLVARFGSAAVDAIGKQYMARRLSADLLGETLHWLGRIDDAPSHDSRFWFLAYCLRDENPTVRSGAALGLASLEDARAIPYLAQAAQSEPISLLRTRIEEVVNELRS